MDMDETRLSTKDMVPLFHVVGTVTRALRFSPDEAEDLRQNVLVKILGSKSVPREFTRAWVYQVVKNAAVDFYRAVKQEAQVFDRTLNVSSLSTFEEGLAADYIAPGEIVDYGDMYDAKVKLSEVRQVLEVMPVEQRQALLLRAEGLSYSEIATVTGANIGTVRSRISHGRARARELVSGSVE